MHQPTKLGKLLAYRDSVNSLEKEVQRICEEFDSKISEILDLSPGLDFEKLLGLMDQKQEAIDQVINEILSQSSSNAQDLQQIGHG
jgi:hypothetical protein